MSAKKKEVAIIDGGLVVYQKIIELYDISIMDKLTVASTSIQAYTKVVSVFFKEFGAEKFEDVQGCIRSFVLYKKDKSLRNLNSQRVRKYGLRAYFLEYFKTAGEVMLNRIKAIFESIKLAKEASKAIVQEKTFKVDDIDAMLHLIALTKKQETVVKLLYTTGLRASEAIGIRVDDIKDSTHHDYYIVRVLGKGSKYRSIYVEKAIVEQLRGLYESTVYLLETRRRGSTALDEPTHLSYDSLYSMIKLVEKKAAKLGISVNPHKFRHSFASHSLEKMKDDSQAVSKISKTLGHSSTAITQDYYIHTALSVDDMIMLNTPKKD